MNSPVILFILVIGLLCIAFFSGMLMPKVFSSRIAKIGIIVVGAMTLLGFILPFSTSFDGVSEKVIEDGQIFESNADVKSALILASMTETFAKKGNSAGLLKKIYLEDIRDLAPGITRYDREKEVVLWMYKWRPQTIKSEKNALRISGKQVEAEKIFFIILPKSMIPNSAAIILE